MHELEKMKSAQVQQVDEKMSTRESREYSTAHFPIAASARTDEIFEQFQ